MNFSHHAGEMGLKQAIGAMAWHAVREQVKAPCNARGSRLASNRGLMIRNCLWTLLLRPALSRCEAFSAHSRAKLAVRFELYLDAPPQPLRGRATAAWASAPADNRGLLCLGIQQHFAFQPYVQGMVWRYPREHSQASERFGEPGASEPHAA